MNKRNRCYLYAITDRPARRLPDMPGLEGASLHQITAQEEMVGPQARPITAVVSPFAETQVRPTAERVLAHEAIVEALMADRAVLPVRFGTILADGDAVRKMLAEQHDRFIEDLRHVAGRVELGLRVLWDRDEPESREPFEATAGEMARDGRTYLMQRVQETRAEKAARSRAEALAVRIHEQLAPKAADSTRQVLSTPRFLLTAAYLVENKGVDAFRDRCQEVAEELPRLRFLCTGPWPAYHFVTGDVPGKGG